MSKPLDTARDHNTDAPQTDRYLAATHEVINQPKALADYNLFEKDIALREAVLREGAGHASESLTHPLFHSKVLVIPGVFLTPQGSAKRS